MARRSGLLPKLRHGSRVDRVRLGGPTDPRRVDLSVERQVRSRHQPSRFFSIRSFLFSFLVFLQNLSGRRVRTKVAKAGGRGRRPERTLRTRTGRPESRTTKTAASTTPSPTKPASAGGPTGTRAPSSTLCAKLRVPRTQRRDRLEYTSGSGPGTARVVVVVDTTARWLPPRPPPPVDGTMVMDDIRAESIIRS